MGSVPICSTIELVSVVCRKLIKHGVTTISVLSTLIWLGSSVVEQSFHRRLVGGSNPPLATIICALSSAG